VIEGYAWSERVTDRGSPVGHDRGHVLEQGDWVKGTAAPTRPASLWEPWRKDPRHVAEPDASIPLMVQIDVSDDAIEVA
jgi:hypothetical protein